MRKGREIRSSIPKVDGSKLAVIWQSRAFTQYLRKIAQHDLQSAVTKDLCVEKSPMIGGTRFASYLSTSRQESVMFIHEMTEFECRKALQQATVGRLACSRDNQPYVVPIYFVLPLSITRRHQGLLVSMATIVPHGFLGE